MQKRKPGLRGHIPQMRRIVTQAAPYITEATPQATPQKKFRARMIRNTLLIGCAALVLVLPVVGLPLFTAPATDSVPQATAYRAVYDTPELHVPDMALLEMHLISRELSAAQVIAPEAGTFAEDAGQKPELNVLDEAPLMKSLADRATAAANRIAGQTTAQPDVEAAVATAATSGTATTAPASAPEQPQAQAEATPQAQAEAAPQARAEETTQPAQPEEPVFTERLADVFVTASKLNIRVKPTTDSEILSTALFCSRLLSDGESAEWLRVQVDGKIGYVWKAYTSREMVFDQTRGFAYVNIASLNLRADPHANAGILAQLPRNTKLTLLGCGDGWWKVRTAAGVNGYVYAKHVTLTAPVTPTPVPTPKPTPKPTAAPVPPPVTGDVPDGAKLVVAAAYRALGSTYVFGGARLGAMDCSGLTTWAYAQVGVSVPRITDYYGSWGRSVPYSQIQPGDILCMDTKPYDGKTSITHVGIYIGNGNMIHASSRMGCVVIRDLASYLGYSKLLSVRRWF